jgi:hypothetical protein
VSAPSSGPSPPRAARLGRAVALVLWLALGGAALLAILPVSLMLAWSLHACTPDGCTTYWPASLLLGLVELGLLGAAGFALRNAARTTRRR